MGRGQIQRDLEVNEIKIHDIDTFRKNKNKNLKNQPAQ